MNIGEEQLKIMICPECKGRVELKEDGSGIKCVACRRVYPVRDGIPAMVAEEATIEDEEPAPAT
ncbi:MAG TPA: Trm112 family protein [Pyrinomonadaceae bacterium]|jgi:uncharacterized protein YbaR (Trm112 family)|nr:Trm112 family protein [Pyrinomonadaceae bacterium]